ncbi:glycoside hydrolase family 97 N-terminal domain-containing protein [Streptomyces shenzhenensis]|uniref:glycoside hydrolase family 97 N-terminal domain-containing protein n=1 Tax=Streptomyces shenzhenensis TaxID=943815 RepID=UPI003D8A19F6
MASVPNRRAVLGVTAGAVLSGALTVPATASAGPPDDAVIVSPNGRLRVTVRVADGRLRYEVTRHGRVLVASSGLGLDLAGRPSLTGGLVLESVRRRTIDEQWRPVWGPDALVRNHAREGVLRTVQPATGLRLDLVVRVFDDGVGFRDGQGVDRPEAATCRRRRYGDPLPPRVALTVERSTKNASGSRAASDVLSGCARCVPDGVLDAAAIPSAGLSAPLALPRCAVSRLRHRRGWSRSSPRPFGALSAG